MKHKYMCDQLHYLIINSDHSNKCKVILLVTLFIYLADDDSDLNDVNFEKEKSLETRYMKCLQKLLDNGELKQMVEDSVNTEKNPLLQVPTTVKFGLAGLDAAREKYPDFFALYDQVNFDETPQRLITTFVNRYLSGTLPDIGSTLISALTYLQIYLFSKVHSGSDGKEHSELLFHI